MEVSKIGAVSMPADTINKEVESKGTVVNSNKGRDRKKLIAAALGGLAVAGVAALAIYKHKKVPSELGIDEFRKIGKFDKGFAEVKGKPFSGKITVPNKNGKTVIEYTKGQMTSSTRFKNEDMGEILGIHQAPVFKKVYSQKDGAKIVEEYGYNQLSEKILAEPYRKTVISENGITSDKYDRIFGKLHSEVKKQPDGSILSTREEIGDPASGSPGTWHIKTKNTKTREILDDRIVATSKVGTKCEKFTLEKSDKTRRSLFVCKNMQFDYFKQLV